MSQVAGYPLYEDKPAYSLLLKLLLVGLPASLIIGALIGWQRSGDSGLLFLVIEGLGIALVFWAIFPRSYQVFTDRLRVALGGPFAVNVPFENLRGVAVSSGISFGLNFSTGVTTKHVEILRVRGARIGITPEHPDLFIEQANLAFEQWRKGNAAAYQTYRD